MKNLIAAIAVLGSMSTAHAYTNTFSFNVDSDAGQMWVCGASIKEHSESDHHGGDFMSMSGTWAGTYSSIGGQTRHVGVSSVADSDFNRNKSLYNLDFNLGSEKFGTTYSVTICWEAATFAGDEYPTRNVDVDYVTSTWARAVAQQGNYSQAARLANRVIWSCKGKYAGNANSYIRTGSQVPFAASHGNRIMGNSVISATKNTYVSGVAHNFIAERCTATYTFQELNYNNYRAQDQQVRIDTATTLYRRD